MCILLFRLTVPLEAASLADGECIATSKNVLPFNENTKYHFCCCLFFLEISLPCLQIFLRILHSLADNYYNQVLGKHPLLGVTPV